MEQNRLNSWLTLSANVGVLIGLILLIVELDQTRDMMRSQNRHQIAQEDANFALVTASNRDIAVLIDRAANSGQLTGADHVQSGFRLFAWFRLQENIYYQVRQGLFDEEEST